MALQEREKASLERENAALKREAVSFERESGTLRREVELLEKRLATSVGETRASAAQRVAGAGTTDRDSVGTTDRVYDSRPPLRLGGSKPAVPSAMPKSPSSPMSLPGSSNRLHRATVGGGAPTSGAMESVRGGTGSLGLSPAAASQRHSTSSLTTGTSPAPIRIGIVPNASAGQQAQQLFPSSGGARLAPPEEGKSCWPMGGVSSGGGGAFEPPARDPGAPAAPREVFIFNRDANPNREGWHANWGPSSSEAESVDLPTPPGIVGMGTTTWYRRWTEAGFIQNFTATVHPTYSLSSFSEIIRFFKNYRTAGIAQHFFVSDKKDTTNDF